MFKNLKVKSLLVFFVAVFITACDKDDPAPVIKCYLTNSSYSSSGGSSSQDVYNYSSDNQLTTVVSTETGASPTTTTVTYDSKGNISKIQYGFGHLELLYDANNNLIQEDDFDGTALDSRRTFEYNSSNQMTKEQYYKIGANNTATKDAYATFEYANTTSKNPVRRKELNVDATIDEIIEYQYDDKKTPTGDFLNIGLTDSRSENNVTKEITKDNLGTTLYTQSYVYEYNDKGYPTKSTRTQLGTDYTVVETFQYNCK
jgi:hypothetical protein